MRGVCGISLGIGAFLLCAWVHAEDTRAISQTEKVEIITQIEQEIERARQQVDTAARELAKLHQQKYALGGTGDRAMLGVLLAGEDSQGGVEIIGVTPGGGAANAGMQAGDKIVRIGEVVLEDAEYPRKSMGKVLRRLSPGDDVAITFQRGDAQLTTNVTTQARSVHMLALLDDKTLDAQALGLEDLQIELKHLGPEIAAAIAEIPEVDRHVWLKTPSPNPGLMAVSGELASYFDVEEGVVVLETETDSMVKPGDVLLKVGDVRVTDVAQAGELLADLTEDTEVQVQRHGRKRTVSVAPGQFDN